MGEQVTKTPESTQFIEEMKVLQRKQGELEAKIRQLFNTEKQKIDEDYQKLLLAATQWLTENPNEKFVDERALKVIEAAIQNDVDPKDLYWLLMDGATHCKSILSEAKKEGKNEEDLPEFWYLGAWQTALGENGICNLPLFCLTARKASIDYFVQKAKILADEKEEDKKAKLFAASIPFLMGRAERNSEYEH